MSEAGTFMESLGIVHQIYSEQYPYNPIWLTRGLDLPHDMPGEASIQRAIRWTQRVGVSVEKKEGEFVCLLEFPPLPSLYHPTVLDGVTAYFCPTPESFVPQVVGGAAMDLNTCSMDFAQEFIAVWPDMRFAKCLGPAEIPDLASCIKCYDARPDHLNKLEREPGIQSVSVEWIGRVRAD